MTPLEEFHVCACGSLGNEELYATREYVLNDTETLYYCPRVARIEPNTHYNADTCFVIYDSEAARFTNPCTYIDAETALELIEGD